jgi:hypothetical protein
MTGRDEEADDLALINSVMTMPFDDLLAMALQEDEIDAMLTTEDLQGDA